MSERQFPCNNCGANLVFAPGQQSLQCPYCESANEIAGSDVPVVENDFHQKLSDIENQPSQDDVIEVSDIKCQACGAEFSITPGETAGDCAYCATPFVLEPQTDVILKPNALLPFQITSSEGMKEFKNWVSGLWFAPNKLKEYARTTERLKGIYLAHWTYDSNTTTSYMGSRGEHYYVTESYTDSEGNRKTRQVRKTRWYPASGNVYLNFDDILVVANDSLPRKYTEKLEPWDLGNLINYSQEYLSGFSSERYSVGLAEGFDKAKDQSDGEILRAVRRDIGGDEQRVHSRYTEWGNVKYKHILLPVWVTAYRYKDDVYRVVINARTGEVQGERPWSWVKITLVAILAIAVIAGVVYLFNK